MQNAVLGSEGRSTLFLTGRTWSPPCLNNALNALMPPRNTAELRTAHREVGQTVIDGLSVIMELKLVPLTTSSSLWHWGLKRVL